MSWFENRVPAYVEGPASVVDHKRGAVLRSEILQKTGELAEVVDPDARASQHRAISTDSHHQSRQLNNEISKPRKRKRVLHPSPEALAAQYRRSREERAPKDIPQEQLTAIKIDDQSQAHTQALREVDSPTNVTIATKRMEPNDKWAAMEAKHNRAEALPTSVTRADSMYVSHKPFQQKSQPTCSYRSVHAVSPDHSSTKLHVVISTWKRSAPSLQIKRTRPDKMIRSPPFRVSRGGMPAGQVYIIKHRHEKGSSVGNTWQQQEKRMYFFEEIPQYTKIKYAIGDILNVAFPDGPGGYAKLVEIRGTEDVFIVVQWLYSRTDVASIGGNPPSLDCWPENSCVLSDHFQVVGIENIEDKKGPTPLKDVYWQISGNSLRSLDEINQKLEEQLT